MSPQPSPSMTIPQWYSPLMTVKGRSNTSYQACMILRRVAVDVTALDHVAKVVLGTLHHKLTVLLL